jgi:hypothetical protein
MPEQVDAPLLSWLRVPNCELGAISCELASMQFCLSPVDALFIVQNVLKRLDKVVKENALHRKLGQFLPMVDEEQRDREMTFMSFDDAFSMFFTVLSINPPRNVLAICRLCEQFDGLSSAVTTKMVTLTLASAIKHISGFTGAQLVPTIADELDLADPLGIL